MVMEIKYAIQYSIDILNQNTVLKWPCTGWGLSRTFT